MLVQEEGEGGIEVHQEETEEVAGILWVLKTHISVVRKAADKAVVKQHLKSDSIIVRFEEVGKDRKHMDLRNVQQLVFRRIERDEQKTLLLRVLPLERDNSTHEGHRGITLCTDRVLHLRSPLKPLLPSLFNAVTRVRCGCSANLDDRFMRIMEKLFLA